MQTEPLSVEDAERALNSFRLQTVKPQMIEPVLRYWQQKRERLGKELIIRLRVRACSMHQCSMACHRFK